jgi:hypothetical protein
MREDMEKKLDRLKNKHFFQKMGGFNSANKKAI